MSIRVPHEFPKSEERGEDLINLSILTLQPNPPNHGSERVRVLYSRPISHVQACLAVGFEASNKERFKSSVFTVSIPWFGCYITLLVYILGFFLAEKTVHAKNPLQFLSPMASSSKNTKSQASQSVYAPPPDDEADTVSAQAIPDHFNEDLTKRMLTGKILAPRTLNRNGVKGAFSQILEDCQDVRILEGQGNTYSFTFNTQSDAERILEGSPWFVLNHLMSLQQCGEAEASHQVNFDLVPFWVQIHGVPIKFLNLETLKAIVHKVGTVMEIEDPLYEGSLIRPFGRARIKIDVMKPFWAGRWVAIEPGNRIWASFKYEKLQSLCYKCGIVGHDQKNCNKVKLMATFDITKPKFGPFLSTYPPKPLNMLIMERVAFKARAYVNIARVTENDHQGDKESSDVAAMEEDQDSNETNKGHELAGEDLEGGNKENVTDKSYQGKEDNRKDKGIMDGEYARNSNVNSGLKKQHQDGQDRGKAVASNPTLIDLTGEPELEQEDGLTNQKQQALIIQEKRMQGGTSRTLSVRTPSGARPILIGDQAFEEGFQQNSTLATRLDLATEGELIRTWNERCTLKRDRGECEDIEEVEQELYRRKRNKKEEWYDEEGNLLMVKVSTMNGTQSYMVDEWGDLTPPV